MLFGPLSSKPGSLFRLALVGRGGGDEASTRQAWEGVFQTALEACEMLHLERVPGKETGKGIQALQCTAGLGSRRVQGGAV